MNKTHTRQFIEHYFHSASQDILEKELLEAVEKDNKFATLVDKQIHKEIINVLENVQTAFYNINPNDTVQSLTSEMEWMSRDAKIVLDKIEQ